MKIVRLYPYEGKKSIIALNDMIKDTKPNKKLSNIVIELFQRGRRLNI